jgi:hypothetical protein
MKTVSVPTFDSVSPANQAIFANLKKALGFVPNLYATFAHSETALPSYLAFQNAKSSLSTKAREVIIDVFVNQDITRDQPEPNKLR